MRALFLICAALLFFALFKLPIGYYTFLRIVITIAAIIGAAESYQGEINFWVISFGLIAIVFNPIVPIYLNNKAAWQPVDFIASIFFIIKAFQKPIKH